jgi:chaperonin GroES
MKNIKVGLDRYVIKPDADKNKKTKSGIILETSEDALQYRTGEIVYAGVGSFTLNGTQLELQFKSGDRVLYEPKQTVDIDIDGERFVVVKETNIILSYNE